jgi:small neutral amino acid transporter SnatA (MarC family)
MKKQQTNYEKSSLTTTQSLIVFAIAILLAFFGNTILHKILLSN